MARHKELKGGLSGLRLTIPKRRDYLVVVGPPLYCRRRRLGRESRQSYVLA